jgi:alcohol dehydrogenase class IV
MSEVLNVLGLGVLRQPREVIFGPGQRSMIAPLVAGFASRVLLCTDERMVTTQECSDLVDQLVLAGVAVDVYSQTLPDLPRSNIMDLADQFGGRGIDAVIGLGGGSCLDMAKAASLMLAHSGDIRDYYGENQVPGPTLPIVTVPTTAGTGAEISNFAVVFDEDKAMKVGVGSRHILPMIAIIDPELTLTCPPGLTAATAADALSHLVENATDRSKNPSATDMINHLYVGKNVLTDVYCREGLRLMAKSMGRVANEPENLQVRSDLMFAAYCGGMALNTAGTAACHAIQAPIGNLTHTPHGFGVGALLPYVMRYNLPAHPSAFAEVAQALGVAAPDASDEENGLAAVEKVEELLEAVGCPLTLEALGVSLDDFDAIATASLSATRLTANNPRELTHETVMEILRRAWYGDRSPWD